VGLLAPHLAGVLDRRERDRDRARLRGLLALGDEDLVQAVAGNTAGEAMRFVEGFDAHAAAERLVARRVAAVCRHSKRYPRSLSALVDSPAVLFCTDSPERLSGLLEQPAVALVGARRASPYGLEMAYELGRGLGAAGVTVVSGLALGIDAAAHRGCLDAGGPALCVLAGGPDVPYPRSNLGLYERLHRDGVVISELPPQVRPFRWAFPARNRIMAGLSAVTVVVEAADPSGSLITSDFAGQMGRCVAAVPGRATARLAEGANKLLKDGALVVTSTEDLLDELFGVGARPDRPPRTGPPDPVDASILDAVEADLDIDGICASAGLPVREARAALTRLELAGRVRRDGLGAYHRTA
jgi:DNA processing protein